MTKNRIIIFISTFLTCFSLSLINMIPAYSLIALLLFIALFYFYQKELLNQKSIVLLIISIIMSLFIGTGRIVSDNFYNMSFSLFNFKNLLKIIISIIGLTPLFYSILSYLRPILQKCNIKKEQDLNIKYLFLFSLIILIGWIPYFLINYPAIISSDVVDQLSQFMGLRVLNDHHPAFHTIYIGTLYKLFSFGSSNFAIAGAAFTQMIILSLIYGYSVYFLNKKGLNKFWTIIMLLFYITPIFGIYSVNLWKDSIFSGCTTLLIISIIKICDNNQIKSYLFFIITSLLCLLFRNNAIYMYVLLILFSYFLLRKKAKQITICFAIVLISYFTIKGPVYNHYDIHGGSSAEYLAIPLQQISRMVKKDASMSEKDLELINNVMDINIIKEVYNPYTSDSIKFNKNFHIDSFDNNKFDYLKLWFRLVIRHPLIATESYLLSTLGFWYPDVSTYMSFGFVSSNELGIYYDPKVPNIVQKAFNALKNKNIPLFSLEYSCSFALFIVLFSLLLCYDKSNKKYLLCYIPMIGLWLSIMIATPVADEFRYIFWSYTSLPILVFIPFKKVKVNE